MNWHPVQCSTQPLRHPIRQQHVQRYARTRRARNPIGLLFLGLTLATACSSSPPGTNPTTSAPTNKPTTATEAQESTQTESSSLNTEPRAALNRQVFRVGTGNVTSVSALGQSADMTVLFLHGAAFTSETWVENGILANMATLNVDAVAVDLPGFGDSDNSELSNSEFLVELVSELRLDLRRTVIVSPSMSGGFSLPALRDARLHDLAGYVPVAPVGVETFLTNGDPVATPALVIWGDQDGSNPRDAAENLASGFSNASVLILPDAGHAAYQHQPDLFTDALVNFVRSLDRS